MNSKDLKRKDEVYGSELSALHSYMDLRPPDVAQYWYEFTHWPKSKEIALAAGIKPKQIKATWASDVPDSDADWAVVARLNDWFIDHREEWDAFLDSAVENHADLPTYAHADLRGSITHRQTWLAHFTDSPQEIGADGFTRGYHDYQRLGLTSWLSDEAKRYGGYNFAVNALDARAAERAYDSYGKHAVLFQAASVPIYHYGDNENQYIFLGNKIPPSSIAVLQSDGWDVWCVLSKIPGGRDCLYRGSFEHVVHWVINNAAQYRRQIFGESVPMNSKDIVSALMQGIGQSPTNYLNELTGTLNVGAGVTPPLGQVPASNHRTKKRKCGKCSDPSKCHCPNVKAEDAIREWVLRMSPALVALTANKTEQLDPNLAALVEVFQEMRATLE